jgi:biotin carboxyl carrier protein
MSVESPKSKESFRVSGKKVAIPAPNAEAQAWSFETRPGGWIVATKRGLEGVPTERRRFFLHEAKGKLGFSVDGSLFFGNVLAETRAGGASAGSELDLLAQFPGKVRKILVAEGAKVEEGAPMLLLEAMKMEFSVKAPYAGTIERILVKEGQQLSPGDRFLDLKKAK